MRFSDFKKINEEIWNEYYSNIFTGILLKHIQPQDGGVLLFPNIILFTETDEHFIVELLGAVRGFNGLTSKNHKEKSTLKYLYQFDSNYKEDPSNSMFTLDGGNTGFSDIMMTRPVDKNKLEQRFRFYDHWDGPTIIRDGGYDGPLLSFGPNFKSVYFDNCIMVNSLNEFYRIKHINHVRVINKNLSLESYEKELRKDMWQSFHTMNNPQGIQYCKKESVEKTILSSQFVNTFLIPGLRETTIGEFINKNPNFITEALSCESFLYEHSFDWIEGNPDSEEKNINPDLMLKREDSFYDICELKLPKLDRKRLAKGRHKRRRFVDDVDEGIAQLANYEEYFIFEKNKAFAKNKYDVMVDDPTLYLIVGNYENLSADEIREASRRLKPNFRVIDYDTLNALFLNKVKT